MAKRKTLAEEITSGPEHLKAKHPQGEPMRDGQGNVMKDPAGNEMWHTPEKKKKKK